MNEVDPSNGVIPLKLTNINPDDYKGFDEIDLHSLKASKDSTTEKPIKDKGKSCENVDVLGPVSFFHLFRFSSAFDKLLIVIGCLAAIVSGFNFPLIMFFYGRVTNAFINYDKITRGNETEMKSNGNDTTFRFTDPFVSSATMSFSEEVSYFGICCSSVGGMLFLLSYIMVVCLNTTAERQVLKIRQTFFRSVLKQDISWYDTNTATDFASQSIENLNKIHDGIGEKIGMFLYFVTVFVSNLVAAFMTGWELTLVILSLMPIIIIATGIISKIQASLTEEELRSYSKAGVIAEEVISAIRTVVVFAGEEKEVDRFDKNLASAEKAGKKRAVLSGIGGGVTWFFIFCSYALGFWYGIKLVTESGPDGYDPSSLVIVFFCALYAAMSMGQASPYLESFTSARTAAASVFKIIDREPPIDSSSTKGSIPTKVTGNIEFSDIHFSYPSRPDIQILQGLNLTIPTGKTVALVGPSGCGKSTLIQLVQRFYDPKAGQVKLDGTDIRDLNIGWLRDHIGVVGQEPVLFGTSIRENIRYGRDGVSQEQIEKAAERANAHDFIMKLPLKYDTLVGERGAQLSGGQKQRIAIARALVRDPKILLLDEATSALDSQSESIVQSALDKARFGRKTVVIAHRLSTIRTADIIVGIQSGQVVEMGSHDELLEKGGLYCNLINSEKNEDSTESNTEKKVEDEDDDDDELNHVEYNEQVSKQLERRTSSFVKLSTRNKEISPEEEKTLEKLSLWKILKLNSPEWCYIVFGCLGSVGYGLTNPAYALLFGDIMGTLSFSDTEKTKEETLLYSCIFLGIGVIAGVSMFLQNYMFGLAGTFLTKRLRRLTFAAMLKQEIGWFDDPKNSSGALCARLASDASHVQGATGSRLGVLLQSLSTIGVSIIIAVVLNWKLGLVTAVFVPLVLIGTYLNVIVAMGQSVSEMESQEIAAKIATEAITNIRTVASLHKEETFFRMYRDNLKQPFRNALKLTHVRGLTFAFAQAIVSLAYAACLSYGGYLMETEGVHFKNIFKVSELLIIGTAFVGQAVAFAPNYNKGLIAAAKIFYLLERKPLIDSTKHEVHVNPEFLDKSIEFRNVHFAYPSRPKAKILRGLNLKVENGQMVALVGSSGCGKSTCIQLLERFYNPLSGSSVIFWGEDVISANVSWIRSHLGLVSQEPVLFDRTIAENIAYGDNSREVTIEEIIEVAVKANIHQFVAALPQGYDTNVGAKGTQLSGGQKQRIAIARALIRNPSVLLLDEATSALDNESEKIVQEALETAQAGRTSIVIAHRLSTITRADKIVVIHQGQVVEEGTHQELISKKGHYYRLHKTQANKS